METIAFKCRNKAFAGIKSYYILIQTKIFFIDQWNLREQRQGHSSHKYHSNTWLSTNIKTWYLEILGNLYSTTLHYTTQYT